MNASTALRLALLLCALLRLQCTPATAQVLDDATAVFVHFQGMFDALPPSDPEQPANVNILPIGTTGSYGAAYGESAGGTDLLTSDGFARLRPGKTYLFNLYTHGLTRLRVKITGPTGHRVFINGIEHEMFDWAREGGVPLEAVGAFAVRLDDGSGAPVGQADSLRPGRIVWSVGLGNLRNGKPAGNLRLVDDGLTASTFQPAGLYFDRDSRNQEGTYVADDGEVIVVKSGGLLRQVYATSVLADITRLSEHAFSIRLFPREQVGPLDSQGIFLVNGTALHEFRIENPSPPQLTALRITKTTNQDGSLTTWTQMTKQSNQPVGTSQWIVDDWVEKTAGATVVSSPSRHRYTYTNNENTEHFEILDSAGAVVQSTLRTYLSLEFAGETTRELQTEIQGYGGAAPITTTFAYHTSISSPGSWRKLKQVSSSDGAWAAFDYHEDFRTRGQLRQLRRPHRDAPAADPGLNSPTGEVTTFSYGYIDNFGTQRLPTLVETRTDGIVTGRSEFSYTEETVADSSAGGATVELPVLVTERRDYSNPTKFLTTRTRTYREDADPIIRFFPGLLRSVEQPDHTMSVSVYFHASLLDSGEAYLATPAGDARVHAILYGTNDSAAGVPGLLPIAAQALPANFRLVAGKSTLSQTLLNEKGLPVLTEDKAYVADWVVTGQRWHGYVGSLLPASTSRRTEATGPRWRVTENLWSQGRITRTTDEFGVQHDLSYDSLGRISATTRGSATANGVTLPEQSVVQSYDAAGRIVSRSVVAAGESLISSTTYDTAGRTITTAVPGQSATRFAYGSDNRTTTVTDPAGGTRTETRLADGRLASVTGTAVVAEYSSYGIEPDGRRRILVSQATPTDLRRQETWTDWLNRPVLRLRPGFNQSSHSETLTYHDGTGQLTSVSRTGYADTRYEYNSMGEMIRSGIDLNGGGLDPLSTDRINDTDQRVESFAGAHWMIRRQWSFHRHYADTRVLVRETRERLTGLSPTLRAETRALDSDRNETIRTLAFDPVSRLVTTTTSAPGQASPAVEVSLLGHLLSQTGHDGLVIQHSYDGLGRITATAEPRTGRTTVSYLPQTQLPSERRDASNRIISRTVYDQAGRAIYTEDGAQRTVRLEYTPRGQVLRRWGSGTYPVAYSYDNYGQRTHQFTYRDTAGSVPSYWESSVWPAGSTPAQITEWEYDAGSGLLRKKFDPAPDRKFVEYAYNERGQVSQRFWSRTINGQRVTTTYEYFPGTGEPRSVTYNDGTPAVSYQTATGESYTRLGQPLVIQDSTGRRDFAYDENAPWRLTAETLPAFYGGRKITPLYETTTSSSHGTGGYGGHSLGSVAGRLRGFRLGPNPSPTSYDLEITCGFTNTARIAGLTAQRTNGTAGRQFVYGYEPTPNGTASALIRSLSVVGNPFQNQRRYETNRDVLISIETLWSGTSRSRHDYNYDAMRRRESVVQTGDAFADLGATHQRYTYTPRGELASAFGFAGASPAAVSDPLAGRLFHYDYDSLGNRRFSNTSGDSTLRDDYVTNDRSQYTNRENNTLSVSGTMVAASSARIAVSGPAPLPPSGGQIVAARVGGYWGTNLAVNNQFAPFSGNVTAYAVVPGAGPGGADLVRTDSKPAFLPPGTQAFSYDEDGNLKSDGLWDYSWDAENRLVSMSTTSAVVAVGRPALTVVFAYDYRHRRVKKEARTGTNYLTVSERRFLYDGWNVVAELDNTAAIKRTFTWGIDLSGGLASAGGVGGLLQIQDAERGLELFPAFDGNGNVSALVNADTGVVEASYEYSPFGELLRSTGPYAQANPFRFSTKWQDDESGLLYYGYRYYSAREGRFLSRDPIEEAGGLNLYGFCGNDSINAWDYLGQKSWLSSLWNRFRHTIISAALYAIPGPGTMLATMYNVGVSGRYGGLRGALTSFAASQIGGQFFSKLGGDKFGNTVMWGAKTYNIGRAFSRGNIWANIGNLASHLVIGAMASASAAAGYRHFGLPAPAASIEAQRAAAAARDEVDPESWTGRIVNPKSEKRSPCPRSDASTVLI